MKKFFAVLMALVLVLSMGVTAFAAGTGTITITNAIPNATYNAYQMLSFVPSNDAGDKGVYTIVAGWEDFFDGETAKNYFVKQADDTVVLKEGVTAVDADLAKAAVEFAKGKQPTGSVTAGEAAIGTRLTVEIADLPLGYYAVDTTAGSVCSLTNTNSNETLVEKNSEPTIDKFVQEDSTGDWGKENSASIGDTVNFKSTITVGKGALKYIVHDKMEPGLTFTNGSVNITLVKKADGTETPVATASYEVKTTDFKDDCDFEIDFTDVFEATLEEGDKLVITYSAVLNENAVIFTETNDNEIWLIYGDNLTTEHHKTETTTFKFDLVKTNEEDTIIDGAEFELYSNSEAGNDKKVTLVKVSDSTYRVAKAGETGTTTIIEAGFVTIYGLDSDAATTYYLKETKAPDGYNAVKDNIEVILGTGEGKDFVASNLVATTDNAGTTYDEGGVEVENKTGGLLPETGGIGTTIFYIVGITLMLGAAILLISKKKMAAKA